VSEAVGMIKTEVPGDALGGVPGQTLEPGRWSDFRMAAKHTLPLMVGLVPFGLAYGIMARQAGLTWLESYTMSLLVFAGAAQFTAVSMLGAGGVQVGLIVFTTLLINLRHLLMGASLAPYLQRLGIWWQALLAAGMVDESYALTITRFTAGGVSHFYFLGANLTLYLAWSTLSGVGAALGGLIGDPLRWGLDFAMPATFIVLLIPQLKGWKETLVCVAAGALAVAGMIYLPGKWYIIVAALAATLIGGGVEELCGRKYS
jgi:4-azaleucine resistance transporter AzlC